MSNRNYEIVTDSGSDLPEEYLASKKIKAVQLSLNFEDGTLIKNNEIKTDEFYEKMRNGQLARTSAPNPEDFTLVFREILEEGKDILYIGFGTGLSTTVNSARIAAEDLGEDYPNRKILVLDTLCGSGGVGLVVYETQKIMEQGATLEEAYEYAKALSPTVAHRFTVETLTYLCRGGRVSKTAAFAGNVLNIKPVLHMDDEGHLIALDKVRGRARSFSMIMDAYARTAAAFNYKIGKSEGEESGNYGTAYSINMAAGAEGMNVSDIISGHITVFLAHAGCRDEALKFEDMFRRRFGRPIDMICEIGPVIGSHSGPGTMALFFTASER